MSKILTKTGYEVQEVEFNGVNLIAARDNTGKIYTSIKRICEELGLDDKGQMQRINRDETLSEGGCKIHLPTRNGGVQETNVLDIEYLPLFLTGIRVNMCKETIRPYLKEFKLKAKEVLAKAFIKQSKDIIQEYLDLTEEERAIKYFQKLKDEKILLEQNSKLTEHNEELQESKNVLDALCSATKLIDMGKFAKALDIRNFGRNNLLEYFRDKKILQSGEYTKNIPYQAYTKWFKVTAFQNRYTNTTMFKTWVKWDAVESITKYLIKEGLLPFGYVVDMREFDE